MKIDEVVNHPEGPNYNFILLVLFERETHSLILVLRFWFIALIESVIDVQIIAWGERIRMIVIGEIKLESRKTVNQVVDGRIVVVWQL